MKLARNIILAHLALLWTLLLISAPVWANTAANTQIIAHTQVSYFDGITTMTATDSVAVTVNMVPSAPNIVSGSAQSTSYAGAGTTLTDNFTIIATSNGPDTYNIIVPTPGVTNTNGATVTTYLNGVPASSVVLGASVTTVGSNVTNIIVPADGVSDNSVNGIEVGDKVVINGETRMVQSVTDNTTGTSTIVLTSALPSAPTAGVLVAQQKIVAAAVTAGIIVNAGTDVTVSAAITATSVSSPGATKTSDAILNTFYSGQATIAKYVRNVTTSAAGTGTAYSYNSINYYPAGVTAKPGDILEYILVSTNTSGTISASVVTDVLPVGFVTLRDNAYGSGKEVAYVSDTNAVTTMTKVSDGDQADYNITTPNTLTTYVGTGATNIAGGTIPTGKRVLVLYQVNVNNPVQGDKIVNSARLSSPDITPATSAVTVTAVIRTASVLELLTYAPDLPTAELVKVSQSAYRNGSATGLFVNYTSYPVPVGSTTPIDLSHPVPLTAATQLHQGDQVFIRLTDGDQNLDKTVAETVFVTITNPANGDVEIIRLTETGPDTGVFTGYLLTDSGPMNSYNGNLSINAGNNLTFDYVDIADSSDHPPAKTIMVDPYGIVLDTSTGLPVNGATITMVNTATGLPAVIYGDDGVSTYPATIISGESATDSSGKVYHFPTGEYRFPFVLPGSYKLQIKPPSGYGYPSTVATATIQALPGGPFTIVSGSRGEVFVINPGPVMHVDVPLDPSTASSLWLQKTAAKDSAGHGDFIPYRLTVTNNSAQVAVGGVRVTDTLPVGFRLRKGSIRINGVPVADPAISADGRTLTFNVGTLAASASAIIDYVAEVTAGTKLGDAINSAIASSATGVRSNNARVTVKIKDDFMRTKSTLMGRVSTGACNEKTGDGPDGVEGVRIYLEDGSFVISDKRGMFHFEGVRSGLHVVQMDLDSLPEGYEAFACTENSRFAGRAFSQFVETKGGTLWRTDFHVRSTKPVAEVPVAVKMESGNNQLGGPFPVKNLATGTVIFAFPDADDTVQTEVETSSRLESLGIATIASEGSSSKLAPAQQKSTVPETKPSSTPEKQEITIKDPEGILYPANNDILVNKVNGVRVCLNSGLTPLLLIDDKEVPNKRIGFTMKDENAGKAIYSYIGVDFGKTGNHVVEIQGKDQFGNDRFKKAVSIKRSGEIVSIRFKSAQGNVADGKTPVKLRLELYDADGTLIPAATELEIREGTLAPLKQPDIFAAPPAVGSHPRVQISREGDVLFQPVNQSGPYRVVLGYNNATVEAETYVQPQMRNWILVGLAEGTAGYNTVSGNMENLQGTGIDENLYKDSRVAFYAKGQIKGKWLLTMAYDSAKTKGNDTNGLFQTINPDTYYTLYGDTTQQQYDSASSRNLYIKIEREQFYAMFGDYDTGMTVTELSRYSRRMTGFKTELQTKKFEVNAFASETEQSYNRDEIPGDGTSGIYRLSQNNIVSGSEKITIEVRDRFRSEVLISSRSMNRFTDYSIDYDAGTIIFKEPVYSRDEKFNPIMIVAEYETISSGGKNYTFGGRAGVKLLDSKLKAGGSYIHEWQGDRSSNLYGADASLKLDNNTNLRGEIAKSEYSAGLGSHSGTAYLAEVSRTVKKYDAKAYYREQEEGFGMGQQPGSEAGTRKLGAEGAYRFTDIINASANVYRQYNLMTDATRDMAEGKFGYSEKNYGASVGFLHANDTLGDGSKKESNQLTMGGRVLTLYDRLNLGLNHAQSIGSNDNSDFPTRTTLSAEYAATKNLTLLAAQEFTWGSGANTQNTRIGMRSSPWSGANITSSVERQFNENDDRVFANVGLKQTVQVNKDWKVDAGVERSQTVAKSGHYQFNTNVQPASGNVTSASGSHEDFTAVSGGATYQIKNLTWDNRVEFRLAESENKWGLMSGLVKEVNSNWALSARLQYFQTSAATGMNTVKADLRQGLVYRPPQTKLIALNRLDFIIDNQSGSGTNYDTWRLVDNLMVNYHPRKDMEASLHYGAKYVQEKIYDSDYSGYTDLFGAEGRYDISKDWDIGVQGSILHSWNVSVFDYCTGLSIGYNIAQNAWLSLGYNLMGFEDKDFSDANYTAQGPFVRFRFKFDQNSVQDAAKWVNGN
jgi:uncharacterized repeat protein (TIGR01451 family)